jgi:NADH/F420H2 dehydrogenase subunit C|tara:strand:- start:10079 stop:10627 length:549 start_codon:yes stop_codon:yes gene_type:complete
MDIKIKKFQDLNKIIPILTYQRINDEKSIVVSHKKLLFTLNCLKLHFGYQYSLLSSISGVDFLGKNYRFSVVYDLLSLTFNSRLRLKVFVNEITSIPSIVNIFINANWWEREVWDMYGIYFDNHPDLRRILTDYGFESYPMRKDFPLSGYVEFRYDEKKKRVIGEPIELTQEFRSFNFEMPW